MAQKFLTDIELEAGLKDNNNGLGSNGQVLSSTGTGVSWIDVASETAERIEVTVKNVSGGSLSKGTVVHASPSATPPSGNVIEVIAADYDDSTKMPAIGILNETIANEGEGSAVMMGAVSGIDTSSFSIGDELYVGNLGTLTNTKPTTAGQLIQKIAVVIKSHASSGLIKIFGAGRSNDVPLPLYIDNTNQRVGIGESSPATTLHVNGRAVIGSSNTIGSSFVTNTNIIGSNNDTADTGVTTSTSVILGDGNGGRYGNVVISERTLKLGTDDNVSSSSSNTTAILDINNSWRASFQYVNVGGFLGYFPPPTSSNEYLFFSANSLNSLSTSTFSAGNAPEAAKLEMEFNPNFGTNSAGNASNALILNAQGNASSAGALYLTASQNNTTSSRGIVTFDLRQRNNNYEPPDGMKMFEITGGWGRTKFVVESGGQNNEASIGIQKDIYHLGDTDTFFSFTAADTFGVTTGGTERLSIGNSGATFSSPVTFSSSISVNGTSTFSDPATFDSDLTLDGISSMTETTALVMNSGNEVGYRTLGSNAFNSTTIPTNNNQLTNGAGYLTAHPSITAASSSDNSGRTYIQDITLDSNGHVTGIATATETVTNTDTNYYLDGITKSGNTLTFSVNGTTNQTYTFGSNAFNSTTIPTNNNQLTNGAGYITGYSETDTLATVTGRGASTSTSTTFSGGLVASGGISGLTLSNGISGSNFNISGVNQLSINDPGEGIVFGGGSAGNITLAVVDDSNDNIVRFTNAAYLQVGTNTVWHAGNDGASSGLDADLLDNHHANRFFRRIGKATATVGPGWMTVAENVSGRKAGEIIVTDADSGDHAYIRIEWMRSYADSNFTVLNCGGHSNRITGARVLYNTSDNTYGGKKLQVYVTTSSNYEVNIYEQGDIDDYEGHSVVTPVIQNTISGYAVHGQQLENLDTFGFAAEEGILSGGDLKVLGTGNGIHVDSTGHASLRLDRASTSYDNNILFMTGGGIKWRLWQDGTDNQLMVRDNVNSYNSVVFNAGGASGYTIFNNPIRIGGTGTANELDDYEEGTYNISFSVAGTSYTATTTNFGSNVDNQCKYVKVGRMVTIFIKFQFQTHPSAWTSSTYELFMNNLPFTPLQGTLSGGCMFSWIEHGVVPSPTSTNLYRFPDDYGHVNLRQGHSSDLVNFYRPNNVVGYYSYWGPGSMLALDWPGGDPGGYNRLTGSFTYYTTS